MEKGEWQLKTRARLCVYKVVGDLRVVSRDREIVSVASRVVKPKHDEMRPVFSEELYQLLRKIWTYKMSDNLKVLTQFYCTKIIYLFL